MDQFQYAFIVKAPGYSLGNQKTSVESPEFKTTVVGVRDLDEACLAAQDLVKNGVKVIDLCCGFNEEDAKEVYNKVDGAVKVSVAAVSFNKK
ncbi:conserved hypothetical protein [Desulfonispora thiosulfatigenes DSM 11270]|uniref:Uncharacterized protein n=1 Tax=Desulfonispora thiosulfatigenes DSM 11270 TaxID=656914 RepID=A0A1W1V365_DESTI|nr:DUF6506 family protein [Desulfonispora thiosulfatigenes]SMB87772.1 conserved hypothetical protein [Desulfonispora thiosulfatigenes DSM 11270]